MLPSIDESYGEIKGSSHRRANQSFKKRVRVKRVNVKSEQAPHAQTTIQGITDGEIINTILRAQSNMKGVSDRATHNTLSENLRQARERLEQSEGMSCCIYRVPWCLRGRDNDNTNAFKPRLVSLGPYHYGDPQVAGMQFHKYRVLDCILKRTGKDVSVFCNALKDLEDQARICYEDYPDEVGLSSQMFVEMMVLDGCFLLDFLVGRYQVEHTKLGYSQEEPLFCKLHMYYGIECDLMLLENQLPVFILNRLYEIQFNSPHNGEVLKLLSAIFKPSWVIGRSMPTNEGEELVLSSSKLVADNNMLSCLEIFWENLMCGSKEASIAVKVQKRKNEPVTDLEEHLIPSVTTLKEAGVKFKKCNRLPFWDIKFERGILEIPQIMVYDASESIFLNLMAFELCSVDVKEYKIAAYVLFMDSLVNTASDAAELRANGIIVGAGRSDEEVADIFNRLGKRVFIPFNQFEGLSERIKEHCKKRRNRHRANLMHNYFNNPWAIISVAAAALLLVLTILQTTYTILPYYLKS